MKYYRFTEPYDALIAAETEAQADDYYSVFVCEREDGENTEMVELDRDHALIELARVKNGDGIFIPPDETICMFESSGLLFVDAELA